MSRSSTSCSVTQAVGAAVGALSSPAKSASVVLAAAGPLATRSSAHMGPAAHAAASGHRMHRAAPQRSQVQALPPRGSRRPHSTQLCGDPRTSSGRGTHTAAAGGPGWAASPTLVPRKPHRAHVLRGSAQADSRVTGSLPAIPLQRPRARDSRATGSSPAASLHRPSATDSRATGSRPAAPLPRPSAGPADSRVTGSLPAIPLQRPRAKDSCPAAPRQRPSAAPEGSQVTWLPPPPQRCWRCQQPLPQRLRGPPSSSRG